MIVILIVYIIRVRIYQRNWVGIGHIRKKFPFLSVIKSKQTGTFWFSKQAGFGLFSCFSTLVLLLALIPWNKIEKKTFKRIKKSKNFQEKNSTTKNPLLVSSISKYFSHIARIGAAVSDILPNSINKLEFPAVPFCRAPLRVGFHRWG